MVDILEAAVQAVAVREAGIATLSQLDREWAELAAGRPVTDAEAFELKRDYEAWVNEMEEVFG